MDYLWFRWTLGWNHQLKKTCLLVGWLMTVSGDVCTCCIFSLNWPIRVRESRFVAENQWSDWPPRILKIPLPNQVIKVKYSNIRLQIFELILSNPNQTFWIFVKPESRFWEANIRFSLHWLIPHCTHTFLFNVLEHRGYVCVCVLYYCLSGAGDMTSFYRLSHYSTLSYKPHFRYLATFAAFFCFENW